VDRLFITIFCGEFAIKVKAFKWSGYWAQGSNRLDFAILVLTAGGSIMAMAAELAAGVSDSMEESAEQADDIEDSNANFLALRLPRLLRLARLSGMLRFMMMLDGVRVVFDTVFSAWQKILSLCCFVLFMQCMFAVFGMQLLGGSLPLGTGETDCWGGPQWGGSPNADCGTAVEYTRRNIETFPRALLTSFQYMTGEAWSQIMFWYAEHGTIVGAPFAYFVVLFVWQFCITISLFVAILLDNFALSEDEKTARQIGIHRIQELRLLGASDPYVEVSILTDGSSTKPKKTPTIKNTLDPVWDQDNVFVLPLLPYAKEGKLLLTVMDWDLGKSDDFLGRLPRSFLVS
jgi:hypothetical protein